MHERWQGDQYLILFDAGESAAATARYQIEQFLPAYTIIGLKGWDDFIVKSSRGHLFTIPTIPIDTRFLAPFELPSDPLALRPDPRFTGLIKWYTKPLVVGGSPTEPQNTGWIPHDQHAQLVIYWNKLYRQLK